MPRRRLRPLGEAAKPLPRPLPRRVGLVGFENLPPRLLEPSSDRFERRTEAANLLGGEHDRVRKLLFGQFRTIAELEEVFHRGSDEIDRRRPRRRNPGRVVPLVRVNDAAERVARGH